MSRPLNKFTVTGSSHDPTFVASVIVPALEAKGLDVACASTVAALVDTGWHDVNSAIRAMSIVLEAYGTLPPPTADGESLAPDRSEEE